MYTNVFTFMDKDEVQDVENNAGSINVTNRVQ